MSEMPSVLIVDDEDGFRSVLVRRLQARGIQAFGIGRGEEALEFLQTRNIDVVLLDIKMPGMSGVDVLRQMREQGCKAEVIVLSGHVFLDTAVEIMNFGVNDYLLKPCDTEELMDRITLAHERKTEREGKNVNGKQ
ncbi:MAG: response regulator [Deltaproteobacteria bacterium]|jgi:DNA-binding response OmpR family regulator|nr:response regulator [Deltaproteobacteria bacterium]